MAGLVYVNAYQVKPGTVVAVIPKQIREKLGIESGTQLAVYDSDGSVVMVPTKKIRGRRGKSGSSLVSD
jgi:AbrB family looped-hinge helix DNA binding protein